jgi:hypothetical protein
VMGLWSEKNTILIIRENVKDLDDRMITMSFFHELEHAYQDQVYGLDLYKNKIITMDQDNAYYSFIEGDAVLFECLYLDRQDNKKKKPFYQCTRDEMNYFLNECLKNRKKLAKKTEPIFSSNNIDQYYYGPFYISEILLRYGALNSERMISYIPTTTEQIYYPQTSFLREPGSKKISTETVEKISMKISHASLASHGEILSDTLGVAELLGLLKSRNLIKNRDAALQLLNYWDGDYFVVLELSKNTGDYMTMGITYWKSEPAAEEFYSVIKNDNMYSSYLYKKAVIILKNKPADPKTEQAVTELLKSEIDKLQTVY